MNKRTSEQTDGQRHNELVDIILNYDLDTEDELEYMAELYNVTQGLLAQVASDGLYN